MTSLQVRIALLAVFVIASILIFSFKMFWFSRYVYSGSDHTGVIYKYESTVASIEQKNANLYLLNSNKGNRMKNERRKSEALLFTNDILESEVIPHPLSQPKHCSKAHCKEYLTILELSAMRTCLRETVQRTAGRHLEVMVKENDCNFTDKSNRKPVALASTEGSGNTWLRGLLEKATGICTGFLYCDYFMRKEGFIGEMIKSGSVLVVKTHTATPQWYGVKYKHPNRDEPYYGSAVFILRNPYASLIAEWNRRATNEIIIKRHLPHNESHTNIIPKEYWGRSSNN